MGYRSVSFVKYSQFTDSVLLHRRFHLRRRGMTVPRLRKLTHMCSRTISGTAYRFRHGSTLCSPTVEKILCRSLFSKRSHIGNLRQIRKQGKGRSSKRKGNRRCPVLFAHRRGYGAVPAAGAAISRAPQSATPRRISAKNFPSVRDEHACAVRVPRSAGAEKCCPDRANRLRGSCIPAGRCRNSLRCG